MFPKLAYTGPRERDTVNPEGITERFILLLAETGLNREELSQLSPLPYPATAKPFSVWASALLMSNDSNQDVRMEG